MAFIAYVDDVSAPQRLRTLLDQCRGPDGHVDNILRIHGHNPDSLEAHFQLYKTLMRGSSALTRIRREMIAVVVSSINGCHY